MVMVPWGVLWVQAGRRVQGDRDMAPNAPTAPAVVCKKRRRSMRLCCRLPSLNLSLIERTSSRLMKLAKTTDKTTGSFSTRNFEEHFPSSVNYWGLCDLRHR